MERLWENESKLCSFINDIQQQGFSKNVGASMFFLETILVPPIKFRPLAKRDETVSALFVVKKIGLFCRWRVSEQVAEYLHIMCVLFINGRFPVHLYWRKKE